MARKRRKQRVSKKSANTPERVSATRRQEVSPVRKRFLRGWRLWAARCLVLLGTPLLALALLEGGLRAIGYGFPTRFFVPEEGGGHFIDNPQYCRQFFWRTPGSPPHPFRIASGKPAGTRRVMILGGSAATGTPEPAFGFWRILGVMLEERHPDKEFELVNAAVRGVNSHIVPPLIKECLDQDPDLFVIYLGNNEAIGLYGPHNEGLSIPSHPAALRALQRVKSTRIGQVLRSWIAPPAGQPFRQDAELFRRNRIAFDDPRKTAVYRNFRRNLQDICKAAAAREVPVVLCTVATNLRDCPPLGSLHRSGLTPDERAQWEAAYAEGVAAQKAGDDAVALAGYRKAETIDDHFADLLFRMAVCLERSGEVAAARNYYRRARDRDALQFRANTRLNEVIREVAASFDPAEVRLVDVERAFPKAALNSFGVPGAGLFHDHVHLTFEGNYQLARVVLPATEAALQWRARAEAGVPAKDQCAEALAFTYYDSLNIAKAFLEMTSRPPFVDQLDHAERQAAAEKRHRVKWNALDRSDLMSAQSVYQEAIRRRPEDWHLHHNLGFVYKVLRDDQSAARSFRRTLELMPHLVSARFELANLQLSFGERSQALENFRRVLERQPEHPAARQAVARLQAAR